MLYSKSSLSGPMLLSGVLYLVLANGVLASPIKSVDEQGNVTYSDNPVEGAAAVSTVPIVPGPSKAEVDAAEQQADKTIKAAKKISQEDKAAREKKKAEQAKSKAADDAKKVDTTPPSRYIGGDPYYYNPPHARPHHPPVHKPKPPGHKPRPHQNKLTPSAGGHK